MKVIIYLFAFLIPVLTLAQVKDLALDVNPDVDTVITKVDTCTIDKVSQIEAETVFEAERLSYDKQVDLSSCLISDQLTSGTYTRGVYTFEVTDTKIIPNGVEVFVRTFKNGSPVGFGADGSVDIERFQFIYPNVLIGDENGSLLITSFEDGKMSVSKASVNPQEFILKRLEYVLSIKKEVSFDESLIIPNKVGNTTTIVDYNYGTGAGGSYQVTSDALATYALAHDATTGNVYQLSTNAVHNVLHNSLIGGSYYVRKADLQFDTSAIPDTDDISAATLTVYPTFTGGSNNDSDTLVLLDDTSNTNIQDAIASEDFNDFTTTSFGSLVLSSLSNIGANVAITITDTSLISKTGNTRVGLRFQKDISNTAPSGSNVLRLGLGTSGDNPFLTIEHAAPSGGGGGSTTTSSTTINVNTQNIEFILIAIFFMLSFMFFALVFNPFKKS